MDGVLNINKPSGMTSHDVVAAVRRILNEKRVGHTGTLDPMATGVLVLCVGKATRIAQYLEAAEKEYSAELRLGITTDTLDAEGAVLETRNYTPPGREDISRAMRKFIGKIMQQPPVFSAIKVSGIPSYELARQGKAAPLKPRQVTIGGIVLESYEDPFVRLSVTCSRGTYIRTLCADLGSELGMGAHLTGLVRTRSGRFSLEQAFTLDRLSRMAETGAAAQAFISMDEALADFPEITLDKQESVKISNGNPIPCTGPREGMGSGLVRLHDPSGRLIAVGRTGSGLLKPELVFK